MGTLLREPGEGAPLPRTLKVLKGRLWGWESLFMGAQLGNLEWAHLLGTLRYGERGSRGGASLSFSLWELCEGNLEGGLPCWVP